MSTFNWFASFVLAATIVPALPAEPHCPGNVASVPFHLTNSYQTIVAVSVNHFGPYNFLLDTGTQVTMVDPSLAAELHLNTQGSAEVAGVGFLASAPVAQVDLLEAGSHAVANQKVLVFDFQNSHSVDLHLFRGVLGEDFLGEFDMLIDNAHKLLCLDGSSAMAADVKGPHITLVAPARAANGMPALRSLIIAARLSDGTRPVRLKLDSGTNVSFLFYTARYMPLDLLARTSLLGGGLERAQRPVSTMPLQDLQIGSLEIPKVPFFTYADSQEGLSRTSAYDGLLTLGIFRRVFICHTHHFAVFEPW
ncbi:MAG TPA: retropepsin-like aspartic protease [Terriglobales bacterium]|nr:retropepsin-like aspartic protease [Terriglobales bacterium]